MCLLTGAVCKIIGVEERALGGGGGGGGKEVNALGNLVLVLPLIFL